MDEASARMLTSLNRPGGAVAQLGARLDGIEEVVGSNPIGSTKDIGSGPETWVRECNVPVTYVTPRAELVISRVQHPSIKIEAPQITIHTTTCPEFVPIY